MLRSVAAAVVDAVFCCWCSVVLSFIGWFRSAKVTECVLEYCYWACMWIALSLWFGRGRQGLSSLYMVVLRQLICIQEIAVVRKATDLALNSG